MGQQSAAPMGLWTDPPTPLLVPFSLLVCLFNTALLECIFVAYGDLNRVAPHPLCVCVCMCVHVCEWCVVCVCVCVCVCVYTQIRAYMHSCM